MERFSQGNFRRLSDTAWVSHLHLSKSMPFRHALYLEISAKPDLKITAGAM